MGTRADFYVGNDPETMEWLGSIAWDGYPSGHGKDVLAETEEDFRAKVAAKIETEDSGTTPEMGWPWPWDDSATTDYAYAFVDGQVLASDFGRSWFVVDPAAENFGEREDTVMGGAKFPDMSDIKAVTFGDRSGVILLGVEEKP